MLALSIWGVNCTTPTQPNFIVVVVDTLRADRVDGSTTAPPTPHFDALRSRAASFDHAYATAPWTLPSLASLFTSQRGSSHKVVLWGMPLPPDHLSLTEVLRQANYTTGAWMTNVLFGPDTGFQQGFDQYQVVWSPAARTPVAKDLFPNADASRVNRQALEWIDRHRREDPTSPFFVYLHYMEPHTPYRCPPRAGEPCRQRARALNGRLHNEQWDFETKERREINNLYRAEVRRADTALGVLMAGLERRGLLEDTWLIVTSDHGEQLGEGGIYLHGKSLDAQEIRVPLIFRGPDTRRQMIQTPVSLIDVAPTVLDLANIPIPTTFEGRSLVPAIRGRALGSLPVVAEIFQTTHDPPRHRLAVIRDETQWILSPDGSVLEFDLRENAPQRSPQPSTRTKLEAALGAIATQIDFRGTAEAPEIDPETRERMRALGYDGH
ncbi:sulfatase [Myxococcota bacterium]|nr:sulfatase [Myxococcota bacterium]